MQKRLVLVYILALFVSATIGYVDTHTKTDDNLPIVLILVTVTFLFGVIQPKQAWQWALIIGYGLLRDSIQPINTDRNSFGITFLNQCAVA